MKGAGIILLALACAGAVNAQNPPVRSVTINGRTLVLNPPSVSRSQQFHVRKELLPPLRKAPESGEITLEPTLAAISAERVKHAILTQLRLQDAWAGKIHLNINPAVDAETTIPVVSVKTSGGWMYVVNLPGRISEVTFVRAITQAVLTELANRNNSSGRSAEIPLWLREGFALRLLGEVGPGLLLQPDVYVMQNRVRYAPELLVRSHSIEPLTFTELSEMSAGSLRREPPMGRSEASTLLFLSELLELEQGREAMAQMVLSLGNYWNWQTALVRAYSPTFGSLLDVDKWWALTLVEFKAAALGKVNASESSLSRLGAALQMDVLQRMDTNAEPAAATLTLQEFLRRTSLAEHAEPIARKAAQLRVLQRQSDLQVMLLTAGYASALAEYITAREPRFASSGTLPLPPQSSGRVAMERLIRQLDELDEVRARLERDLAAIEKTVIDPRLRAPERQR